MRFLSKPRSVFSQSRSLRFITGLFCVGFQFSPALLWANPSGGQVVAGGAGLNQAGSTLTVSQSTDKVIINWQNFSIGAGELTKFIQPSASSAALNRVVGDNLSSIYGTLQSNGQIYLINPNGIVVGATGVINTGGFIASTQDVANGEFLNGRSLNFKGNSDAAITNLGSISATGGNVFLIADKIVNKGQLKADGSVGLAGARDVLLTEGEDRLLVRPNPGASGTIENSGLIQGAQADLQAAGGNIYALAIKNEGIVRATGSATREGRVWLTADGGLIQNSGIIQSKNNSGSGGKVAVEAKNLLNSGFISADASSGKGGEVLLTLDDRAIQTSSGKISANGTGGDGGSVTIQGGATAADGVSSPGLFLSGSVEAKGNKGGNIFLLGQDLTLAAATLDVSGSKGKGGNVRVGGDFHGAGDLSCSRNVTVNGASRIKANAGSRGNGGTVVVWSDEITLFSGTISIRGGSVSGNGGTAEVSSAGGLGYGGVVNASAKHGKAGTLLLDPKNIIIDDGDGGLTQGEFLDPNPSANNGFGSNLSLLSGGKAYVSSIYDDFGGADAGAVYIYDEATGALDATLNGTHANDRVGSGGIVFLDWGNYLVLSPHWNSDAGAVTWTNGITLGGGLDYTNSLVGSVAGDNLGSYGIEQSYVGQSYLVRSPDWNGGRGAVTWGSGATGVIGFVDGSYSGNSLVGDTAGDAVGGGFGGQVLILDNGHYVIVSPDWTNTNTSASYAGAVTWINGSTGALSSGDNGGSISSLNSLVGDATNDNVGLHGITTLSSGDFLVLNEQWHGDTGAVSWLNGSNGKLADGTNGGAVSNVNSLVGSSAGDLVGSDGVTSLNGGNYLIRSSEWGGTLGAVTFQLGSSFQVGQISSSNSLVGSTAGDYVGLYAPYVFNDGSYLVRTQTWNNGGSVSNAGAVTFGAAGSGVSGVIDGTPGSGNSLVGTNVDDRVGSEGIYLLDNDNYLIRSSNWNGGLGAVTFMAAGALVSGDVSSSNSLVGSFSGDNVGAWDIYGFSDGSYLVLTPNWNGDKGAVTFGGSVSGVTGAIDGSVITGNSLVGSSMGDRVGDSNGGGRSVIELGLTGNFLIASGFWDGSRGAVTFVSGGFISGVVGSSNSLVGNTDDDGVGKGGDDAIHVFSNGDYVVLSKEWAGGGNASDALGAVTWGSGTSGITGFISSSNSLLGDQIGDRVGNGGVGELGTTGNYILFSPDWHGNKGAVTFAAGGSAIAGTVSNLNSLVGSTAGDNVGGSSTATFSNGDYLILSPNWDNGSAVDAGAVTWGSGSTGVIGDVSSGNSLVGDTSGDKVGSYGIHFLNIGNYLVISPDWHGGKGAATFINNPGSFVTGAVNNSNSLAGSAPTDHVGQNIVDLFNGNYLVITANWNGGRGAVTFGNQYSGVSGSISSSNSLVGSSAGDSVGGGGIDQPSYTKYLVKSPLWNGQRGAVTIGDSSSGVTGVIDSTPGSGNSLVGASAGDKVGSNGTSTINGTDNFVIFSPHWGGGKGAVSWQDPDSFVAGVVSSSNSLVGSLASDGIGADGIQSTYDGYYLVISPNWGNNAGAITMGFEDQPLTGVISSSNSLIGGVANSGLFSYASIDYSLNMFFGQFTSDSSPMAPSNLTAGGHVRYGIVATPTVFGGSVYFSDDPSGTLHISAASLAATLATTSVTLQANNDITLAALHDLLWDSGGSTSLTLQAGRSILLNSDITTNGSDLILIANEYTNGGYDVVDAYRDAGQAVITMASGTSINTLGTSVDGALTITMKTGDDKTNYDTGAISLELIRSGDLTVTHQGTVNGPSSINEVILNGDTDVYGNLVVDSYDLKVQKLIETKAGPGDVTFTVANQYTQELQGDIVLLGDFLLDGGGQATLGGGTPLPGPADVASIVSSGGSVTFSDPLTMASDTLLKTSGGTIDLTGGLAGAYNISLESGTAGDIVFGEVGGGIGAAPLLIKIQQAHNVTVNSSITAGKINVVHANDFNQTDGVITVSGSGTALDINAASIELLDVAASGGGVRFNSLSGLDMSTGNLQANNITLQGTGPFSFGTGVVNSGEWLGNVTGNVTIDSGGGIVLGNFGASGTLDLTAVNDITQTGTLNLASGTLLAESYSGSIILNHSGNKILNLGNTSAFGQIDIFEDPGLTVNGAILAGGNILIGSYGGNLTLQSGTTLTSTGGDVTLYTDYGNNVINLAGTGVMNAYGDYVVYTTDSLGLGGLLFDVTLNATGYPASGIVSGLNTLVLLGPVLGAPTLDNVDTEPYTNNPVSDHEGELEGEGLVLIAYVDQDGSHLIDNSDGFIGIDSRGNILEVTDPKIIVLLKAALDNQALQDLLAAIGATEEEFQLAEGSYLVLAGDFFDFSDLSSKSLANAPQVLQDALSDKAKAELEALLGLISGETDAWDGIFVTAGQVVDMDGTPLPGMPPVLVIALSPAAQLDLERTLE